MTLRSIDISSFQQGINLANVPRDLTIIKLTEEAKGWGYVNPLAATWINETRGQLRGLYHFIHPDIPATEQACFFLSNAGTALDNNTRPILDYEPTTQCQTIAATFLDIVAKETGRGPIDYMDLSNLKTNWPLNAKHYPVWLAAYVYGTVTGYNYNPNNIPTSINGFDVIGQQFTSKGKLPGYNGYLDLSIFNLTADEWRQAPPAITVKDGYDMATLADLENVFNKVLNGPLFAAKVSDAVKHWFYDNLIDVTWDSAGKATEQFNVLHVLTDIFRDTREINNKTDAQAKALAAAHDAIDALTAIVKTANPNVDVTAVTDALTKLSAQLDNSIYVAIPNNAGKAPSAQ